MPSIQFSGLASGLDTEAIVGAILAVEKIPKQRIEAQNSDLRSQGKIIDRLSSALSALGTKATALGTSRDFLSFTGKSSDETVGKLAASGDAVRGTYNLKVSQLASAQRNYSKTFTNLTDSVAASDTTMDLTINGETTSIDVSAGTTLEELAELINSSGADVSAGIFSGVDGYRLQIVGNKTGADNAITFDAGALGADLELATNQKSDALDALASLDGWDIKSSTNVFADALPGVSLEVFKVDTTGIDVSIAPDTDSVKKKIDEFITAYNGVMSILKEQVGEGKGTNTLNGDSTVRTIESQLSRTISSVIPGLTDSSGDSLSLSRLGIKTQRDGSLQLDSTALTEALGSDFEGAAAYFAGDEGSEISGISGLISDVVEGLTKGKESLLQSRKTGINDRIRANEDRIAEQDRYLSAYEDQLRTQYAILEQTMAQLQSQGNYLAQFMR